MIQSIISGTLKYLEKMMRIIELVAFHMYFNKWSMHMQAELTGLSDL